MARGSRWAAIVLVLALLTVPAALSGSESDPEVEDGKGDTQSACCSDPGEARADIVRAYLRPVNETAFEAVLVVRDWPGPIDCGTGEPTCAWVVGWRWDGRIYAAYGWTYAEPREDEERIQDWITQQSPDYNATFRVGVLAQEHGASEFPYSALEETDGTIHNGTPGRFHVTVPVDLLPEAEPGDVLNGTFAGVLDEDGTEYGRNDRGPDCGTGDWKTNEQDCLNFGSPFLLPGPNRTGKASRGANGTGNGSAEAAGSGSGYGTSGNDTANGTQAGNATTAGEGSRSAEGEALSPTSVETKSDDGVLSGGLWIVAVVGGVGLAGAGTVWWRAQGREWIEWAQTVAIEYADEPAEGHRVLDHVEQQARSARQAGRLSSTGLLRLDLAIGEARDDLEHAPAARSGEASAGVVVPSFEAGRYEVQRELPSGAFGRAWVAEDTKLGREVVVKRLHSRWTRDERVRRAFRREAEILIQTNHPHLVTVHDLDTEDGEISIVMEYVEGGSLEDRLVDGPLPLADVLRIAAEILDGLAHVHEKGIYHRDLKPANVLLTSDGHAKVADFGTAHVAQATTPGLSGAGMQPGTPLYMAPEQVRGEDPDARTDLYALAALVHQALTGEHYLGAEPANQAELARSIVEAEPVLSEGLPEPVHALLAKGLAKDPGERFGSAAEMKEAVERLRRRLEA